MVKIDDCLVLFILVDLPPQGSQYEVTTTSLASVLQHGSTFLLIFNEKCAFEYRHKCLLDDIKFPKIDWSTSSSSSARETSFLNILDDYELRHTILSSTHIRSSSLDKILVPSSITSCFDCHVLPLTRFSDHAAISAKIYTKSSPSSIRIRNYAFAEPRIVPFCSLWITYIFFNYPSADTVADLYHHLQVSVKQSFRSVTRKRATLPTYYSSHTVHTWDKLATSTRKYHSGHFVERNLEDTLEKSLELDKVLYISGKVTSNLDSCFKFIKSFKDKSFPI